MKSKGLIIGIITIAFIAMITGVILVIAGSLKVNYTVLYSGVFTLFGAFVAYFVLGIIFLIDFVKKKKK